MATIAIFSHAHPDFSKGGGEIVAYGEFKAAKELGHEVIFIFPAWNHGPTKEIFEKNSEDVFIYKDCEFAFKCRTIDHVTYNHRDISFFDEIFRIISAKNIQFLHFHHFWGIGPNLILALRLKMRHLIFSITLHEYLAMCVNDGKMMVNTSYHLCTEAIHSSCTRCKPEISLDELEDRKSYFLYLLNEFDYIFSPSVFLAEVFYRWGGIKKIIIQENGSYSSISAPRNHTERSDHVYKFAYFGRPAHYKGIDVIVSAAVLCATNNRRDISFYVFGCTESRFIAMFGESAKKAIEIAGRMLIFCGIYDQDNVVSLMHEYGYIIVPSIWWENSPLVIQEAFLANRPLLVSDIGGMREKIKDGFNGFYFERRNADDLALKICQIAGDHNLWNYLRRNISKGVSFKEYTMSTLFYSGIS